jgi:hypothetical protein
MGMSNPVSLGVPVVLELKSGAMLPNWLNNYLAYLAKKHGAVAAFGPHKLLEQEGTGVPFRLFTGQDLRRVVFPNEQEYTMFLLKWD